MSVDMNETGDEEVNLCSICYLEMRLPIRLPCSHIFCFLCAKGAICQVDSERCPICRHPIPRSFFEDDNAIASSTLDSPSIERDRASQSAAPKWLYEGYHGWWLYDDRSSSEIEQMFQEQETLVFELMIAGHMYVIDLANMIQYRKSNPSTKRTIKRDQDETNIKGVAGIPFNHQQ